MNDRWESKIRGIKWANRTTLYEIKIWGKHSTGIFFIRKDSLQKNNNQGIKYNV